MPAPKIKSPLIELKLANTSNFWLIAENVADNDPIIVERIDMGPGYWEGTIRVVGNNRAARASVRYRSGLPPLSKSKKRKTVEPGDIIEVTITITNAGGAGSSDGNVLAS